MGNSVERSVTAVKKKKIHINNEIIEQFLNERCNKTGTPALGGPDDAVWNQAA